MKLGLSICIITKNESANLAKCLASVGALANEIVVVDTGSTDQTLKVCQKYTSRIFAYSWSNNFSAARNFALTKTTNDIVLMIDSDEVLKDYDLKTLRESIENLGQSIGRLTRKNYTNWNSKSAQIKAEKISRVFSKKYYRYIGRVHEQLVRNDSSTKKINYIDLPIVLEHFGYQQRTNLNLKAKRNLELLKLDLADHPDDPYILYQIGKCFNFLQRDDLVVCYLKKALAVEKNPFKSYVYDCVETLGYAFNRTHQSELGIRLLQQYSIYQGVADYWFLLGILQMNAALFEQAVASFLRATKCKHFNTLGINNYLSYYNIGVIYEVLGEKHKSLEFYQKCGDYALAKEGLKRINAN
ncbi:glycosyltransferase [Liquorilactobacillus sicerae]|uniref:glycosyltransferase n=1 Tax=Liquorilactobacillus sicerae TaxID=1416943 RepID=UPI002480CEAC|nr:glycosyltransferase family 2 protein [Liquorilactobacillus sicerae]